MDGEADCGRRSQGYEGCCRLCAREGVIGMGWFWEDRDIVQGRRREGGRCSIKSLNKKRLFTQLHLCLIPINIKPSFTVRNRRTRLVKNDHVISTYLSIPPRLWINLINLFCLTRGLKMADRVFNKFKPLNI